MTINRTGRTLLRAARGRLSAPLAILETSSAPNNTQTKSVHLTRQKATKVSQSGFEIEREERIAFKPSPLVPAIPHILGAARRP